MASTITAKVAIYHSTDKNDEMYWDIPETARKYNISIVDTEKTNYGGQNIFDLSGTEKDLDRFAKEFCLAENIAEIEETL